jgi:hypothetical protein
MPKRTAPPRNVEAWVDRNADRLDYPDAGDPFREGIQIDAPAETKLRLEAVAMGILPGCRFYQLGGRLYRVHQDGTFALYSPGGWQPIEGATLRAESATEVTADVARSVVEGSWNPSTH